MAEGQHNTDFPFEISEQTREKVEIVKKYIADKYQRNLDDIMKKNEFMSKLIEKMNEKQLSEQEQEKIRNDIFKIYRER